MQFLEHPAAEGSKSNSGTFQFPDLNGIQAEQTQFRGSMYIMGHIWRSVGGPLIGIQTLPRYLFRAIHKSESSQHDISATMHEILNLSLVVPGIIISSA